MDRGIKHVIGADDGAGVRHRGTRAHRMASGLHQNHRLQPRRRAQTGQETSRIAHTFDVKQDVFRLPIVDQVIDDLAEIDVPRTAH